MSAARGRRTDAVARGLGPRPDVRTVAVRLGLVALTLASASVVIAVLEGQPLGFLDASPVYFVAIVLVGSLVGTWPALVAAVGAFILYDLFFTEPRLTLIVEDPREWLDLVLFLVLAIVVGRLSALGSERAAEASRRAAEAAGLFTVGRILATSPDVETAAPLVATRLLDVAGLRRVWISVDRPTATGVRILADTHPSEPLPASAFVTNLVRMPDATPARWQRAHEPVRFAAPLTAGPKVTLLRIRMEADGLLVGSIHAVAGPDRAEPDRSATRLLGLAADQLGFAIRRDALRQSATEAEIARQGDALKSALLDAVSHDLRTPLASIRAQAGTLADHEVPLTDVAARSAGAAIDLEAERLDRLVREVLDYSRVEAGSLRPDLVAIDLADAVRAVVDRLRPLLGARDIEVDIADDLLPVAADAVLLDGIVSNLVENVARHAPPPAALRIAARVVRGAIELTIDDGGPGVPVASLGRLFERFDRLPAERAGSRRGIGLGLSIVRGFAGAMNAGVHAEASPLGGLRMVVRLPVTEAFSPAPSS